MMSQPTIPEIRYSWRLPLLLSLLLHTGLAIPFLFRASEPGRGLGNDLVVDTVVFAGSDVTVTLDDARKDAPIAQPEPAVAAPALATSATGTISPESPNKNSEGLVSSLGRSSSQTGSSEAQEEPTAVPARGLAGTRQQPGHGKATTSFFSIETEARNIVYVIDRSASMGLDGKFDAARRELLASLERLPDTAHFQVIAYNRGAEPLHLSGKAGLVPATPNNKRQAAGLLETLYPEGGTEHVRALRQALALQPDVIYFFTDADDLKAEQIRALTLFNHGRSVIHAVESSGPKPGRSAHPLHALADQNQGVYRSVSFAP
jgi:hypothetical protein